MQREPSTEETWPQVTATPDPKDLVQVLMTEEMARRFEARVLTATVGLAKLSAPLLFSADDLPTYIIDVEARTA